MYVSLLFLVQSKKMILIMSDTVRAEFFKLPQKCIRPMYIFLLSVKWKNILAPVAHEFLQLFPPPSTYSLAFCSVVIR